MNIYIYIVCIQISLILLISHEYRSVFAHCSLAVASPRHGQQHCAPASVDVHLEASIPKRVDGRPEIAQNGGPCGLQEASIRTWRSPANIRNSRASPGFQDFSTFKRSEILRDPIAGLNFGPSAWPSALTSFYNRSRSAVKISMDHHVTSPGMWHSNVFRELQFRHIILIILIILHCTT